MFENTNRSITRSLSQATPDILFGMSNWVDEVASRIGREVAKLRGERSGQWLSDQTAAVGKRISKASISEIENGKRKSVSVADLMVLAAALEVPPIVLLFPGIPDGNLEVLPGRDTDAWSAVEWFVGEDKRDSLPKLVRHRNTTARRLKEHELHVKYGKVSPSDLGKFNDLIESYKRWIDEDEEKMRAAGGTVDDER